MIKFFLPLSLCVLTTMASATDKILQNIKTITSAPQSFLINGVENTIDERMEYYGVPGASILVIKDYKVLWSKHYLITTFAQPALKDVQA